MSEWEPMPKRHRRKDSTSAESSLLQNNDLPRRIPVANQKLIDDAISARSKETRMEATLDSKDGCCSGNFECNTYLLYGLIVNYIFKIWIIQLMFNCIAVSNI
jgi:hypothetical protein